MSLVEKFPDKKNPAVRPVERETEIAANKRRLAIAAHYLLQTFPHDSDFDINTAISMEEHGDTVVAGMIEFGVAIAGQGKGILDEVIEKNRTLRVQLDNSPVREGLLVAIEGIGGSSIDAKSFLQGLALIANKQGEEFFMPVGISREGNVNPTTSLIRRRPQKLEKVGEASGVKIHSASPKHGHDLDY